MQYCSNIIYERLTEIQMSKTPRHTSTSGVEAHLEYSNPFARPQAHGYANGSASFDIPSNSFDDFGVFSELPVQPLDAYLRPPPVPQNSSMREEPTPASLSAMTIPSPGDNKVLKQAFCSTSSSQAPRNDNNAWLGHSVISNQLSGEAHILAPQARYDPTMTVLGRGVNSEPIVLPDTWPVDNAFMPTDSPTPEDVGRTATLIPALDLPPVGPVAPRIATASKIVKTKRSRRSRTREKNVGTMYQVC